MTNDIFTVSVSEKGVYIYCAGLTFPLSRFIELINKDLKKRGYDQKDIKTMILDEIVLRKYENNNLDPTEPTQLYLWEIEEYCTGKPMQYMRHQTKTNGVI